MLILVCSFVRSFGPSLSRALNLHLFLSGQSQVSLRSVSGQFQVSLHLPNFFIRQVEPKKLRLVFMKTAVLPNKR